MTIWTAVLFCQLLLISCSNKVDEHLAKMTNFIEKWEKKVEEKQLTESEKTEFTKEHEDLERSAYEIKEKNVKPDFDQTKKSEELEVKISQIVLRNELGPSKGDFMEN